MINPRFQWKLIGYASSIAALILISVYGLFVYGFQQFVQLGTQAGFAPDHPYFRFLILQEGVFLKILGALALVVAVILVMGGLVISHKIAGPLYRMKSDLTTMANQSPPELKRIKFRKGDYFPELADAFNSFVEAFQKNKP